MKKKNGFTLVELLAIIIILGIIALITVPVILDIIDKSKEGAIKDSAYGYVDAVNKLYFSGSLHGRDGVSDGYYTVAQLNSMGVSVSVEPSEGWVELEDDLVVSYSLKFGDYVVTKYSSTDLVVEKRENINLTPEEEEIAEIYNSAVGIVAADGAKYLTTAQEVYYNPVSGEKCNSSDSVSTTGTVTGCMHWYLYSVKGDYANMLLDHNITDYESANAKWAYSDTYNDLSASSAGITYPGVDTIPEWSSSHNSRGPVTALNTLKSLTTNWKTQTPKVPNSTSTNEYIITKDKNDNKYQIDYTGYKARLITKEEAGYLGCTLGFKSGFTGVISSCREWMIKSTYGENSTLYEKIIGYWTSSPVDGNSSSSWTVYYYRYMMSVDAIDTSDNHSYFGIRPVITVKITDVLSQS